MYRISVPAIVALSLFALFGLLLTTVTNHITIGVWGGLFVVALLLAIFSFSLIQRRGWSAVLTAEDKAVPLTAAVLWRFVPYLSLLPAIVVVATSIRVQLSYHGYFHSGYIFQFIQGRIPVENVTLPGYPANTYWLYDALLATLTNVLQLPPAVISSLLNFLTLILTLLVVRQILLTLLPALRPTVRLEFMTLFSLMGINLYGFFQAFLGLVWFYRILDIEHLGPIVLYGQSRLRGMLHKYLNFNGFPIGILCYVFILYVTIRLLQKRSRPADLVLALLAQMASLAFHPTTGLFILVVVPAALIAILLVEHFWWGRPLPVAAAQQEARRWWREEKGWLILAALILLFTIPLALYIRGANEALYVGSSFSLSGSFQLGSTLAVTYPVIPFFIAGVVRSWRQRDQNQLFLALVCLGGFALAYVARLPDGNEYKFIFLGTIAMCLVSVSTIEAWLFDRRPGRLVPRFLAWTALVAVCLNLIFSGLQRGDLPRLGDEVFAYEGIHVVAHGDLEIARAEDVAYHDVYRWIRDNLPLNTIVIIPQNRKDQSAIYVLAERLPYVVDGIIYNTAIPEYTTRMGYIAAVYENGEDSSQELATVLEAMGQSVEGRPLVLVYPHESVNYQKIRELGLSSVYNGRVADLYAINNP